MSDHKEKAVKKQMTEAEKAEAKAVYDQVPDTYEEWEEQRADVRMEFAK